MSGITTTTVGGMTTTTTTSTTSTTTCSFFVLRRTDPVLLVGRVVVSPADDGDDVVGLGCGFELAVDAAGVGVEALRGLRGETETEMEMETDGVRDISEASSVVVGSSSKCARQSRS